MTDEQKIDEGETEVEGQAKKFFRRGEEAEAPKETDVTGDKAAEAEDKDDPDVEGQGFRGG